MHYVLKGLEEDAVELCASWNDAKTYIKWLNKQNKMSYRLPIGSELEYLDRVINRALEAMVMSCVHMGM